MAKTPKDKDQDKGDELLRRLLKTPPDHRTGKATNMPKKDHGKAAKPAKA